MYDTYDGAFAALHGTERSLQQNKNHDHSAFTFYLLEAVSENDSI